MKQTSPAPIPGQDSLFGAIKDTIIYARATHPARRASPPFLEVGARMAVKRVLCAAPRPLTGSQIVRSVARNTNSEQPRKYYRDTEIHEAIHALLAHGEVGIASETTTDKSSKPAALYIWQGER